MTNQRITANSSAVLLIISLLLGSCNLPSNSAPGVTLEPSRADPTQTALPATASPASPTVEPSPTPVPTFSLPSGYQDYTDSLAGMTISIPDSWTVTGIQEGSFAILQSYPKDKYIGGERREEGDTKCDLNLAPSVNGPEDLKAAWEDNSITSLLAESTLSLAGGLTAYRYEIDNMGRANLILADLDGQLITLTCFGELSGFDSIAETLRVSPAQ